jgi:hypothetical protein
MPWLLAIASMTERAINIAARCACADMHAQASEAADVISPGTP